MSTAGDLVIRLGTDNRPLQRGLSQARGSLRSFASGAVGKLAGIGLAANGLRTIAGAVGSVVTGVSGISAAADFESMTVRMETMLGSAQKAKILLSELETFSAATPFQQGELNEAAAQLLAFGFAAQDIMPNIKNLGDIAAGTQKPIGDFVDILGKVKASGVASLGDINRLGDRGVPIYKALATTMGVAESEIRSLAGSGKIGFKEIQAALKSTTAQGGLFYQAMEKQSRTVNGKWSTLKDNFALTFKDLGTGLIEAFNIKGIIDKLTTVVQFFRNEVMSVIVGGIATIAEWMQYLFGGLLEMLGKTAESIGDLWKSIGIVQDLKAKGLKILGRDGQLGTLTGDGKGGGTSDSGKSGGDGSATSTTQSDPAMLSLRSREGLEALLKQLGYGGDTVQQKLVDETKKQTEIQNKQLDQQTAQTNLMKTRPGLSLSEGSFA